MVRVDDGAALWTVRNGDHGPPVVVLHGGPGLPDYTEPLARLLWDRHFVYRYDQRGSGRSGRTAPWTLERFVADLDALRVAFGVEQWHVVGHSWGATLGLHYALTHPDRVRSLSYLAGVGLEWSRWVGEFRRRQRCRWTVAQRERVEALRGQVRTLAEDVELLELELRADARAPDPIAVATLARHLRAGLNRTVNRRLHHEVDEVDVEALTLRCQALHVPTLVVHGLQDPRPVAARESLVAALPAPRIAVLDAGHALWVEQPGQLRALLREHLAAADAARDVPRVVSLPRAVTRP